MLHSDRDSSRANERWTTCQHFKHHNSERVEIRACRKRIASCLFRREVVCCTEHNAAIRQTSLFGHTDNAKIGKFDPNAITDGATAFGVLHKHDILGLNVTMNKATCMSHLKHRTHLGGNFKCLTSV